MDQVIVLENQSLLDLSIQECGSIEAVFGIAARNGLAITDGIAPGSLINVDAIVNKPVLDYYSMNQLKPATDEGAGGSDGSLADMLNDGIDFMAIQVDNIVR